MSKSPDLTRRPFFLSRRSLIQNAGAALGGVMAGSALAAPEGVSRRSDELLVARLPGLLYMPGHVMEYERLIERHAARLGGANISVRWVNYPTGEAQRQHLMSGQVDIVMSGLVPLLRLWDISHGGVKGIVAAGVMPLLLVSADPRISTLRDIGADARIALPVLKLSTQAVLLQMAASQLYGPEAWEYFERNCVAMPHSAALAALKNQNSPIRLHFTPPPFHAYALRALRAARIIASSTQIIGGAHSTAHFFTTTRFAQANPLIIEALRHAALEAKGRLERNIQDSVAAYRMLSGDKSEAADILEVLAEPGMMDWRLEPLGSLPFAQHMHRVGTLARKPESWRDYYLPASHDLLGS
jgi:NitT/TauT family transport system substrate-binding protein